MNRLRWLTVLAALAAVLPGKLSAQGCGPDWGSGTGTAFAYWVTADSVQRSRHTNLATALLAMSDSIRTRAEEGAPEAEWHVLADFRGEWRGPCGDGSDTTVVTDTVEVCPVGWTCTPPDTTTAGVPMPSGFHIMGWVQSVEYPRDNGIEARWDAQNVDSFTLTGGLEDGSETWEPVELPGAAISHRRSLPYETTRSIWRCITAEVDGVQSEPTCDRMDWSPMVRHEYEVVVSGAATPIAPGDRVLFVLQRRDGSWETDTSTRPDSVVFEVEGQRHVDEIHPHDFPGASDPWLVPTGLDSVIVNWRIYDGPGSKSGGASFEVSAQ